MTRPLPSLLSHHAMAATAKALWDPTMAWALLGRRGDGAVLDPTLHHRSVCRGLYLLGRIIQGGGRILVVTTDPEITGLLRRLPRDFWGEALWYVGGSWVGGTLTNWKQVSRSVVSFASFRRQCDGFLQAHGLDFPQYSKRRGKFQGLVHPQGGHVLPTHPDVVFLLNTKDTAGVRREAARVPIPVVALVDSQSSLQGIHVPMVVNTAHLPSVYGCLQALGTLARSVQATSKGVASRGS